MVRIKSPKHNDIDSASASGTPTYPKAETMASSRTPHPATETGSMLIQTLFDAI
jgi:hypothetical protein